MLLRAAALGVGFARRYARTSANRIAVSTVALRSRAASQPESKFVHMTAIDSAATAALAYIVDIARSYTAAMSCARTAGDLIALARTPVAMAGVDSIGGI